jgi:hypothetical protein
MRAEDQAPWMGTGETARRAWAGSKKGVLLPRALQMSYRNVYDLEAFIRTSGLRTCASASSYVISPRM